MGNRIARDSWAIIERVIRRYPETKKEIERYENEIIYAAPPNDGQGHGSGNGDPTARKAIKLMSSTRLERLKRETEAVEKVYMGLSAEWQKVIRVRFWSARWKNTPYLRMESATNYKEAQLKRVCGRFIRSVGKELGEI